MERDIADIKEFVEDTSLIRLDSRDIMKLHKGRVLHKDGPADIYDAPISNNPYIAVPIEDLVKHDKKHHKEVCFKEPQKRRGRNTREKPVIDPKGDKSYGYNEPEENIWKCDDKVSMKNRPDFVTGGEIALEKIVLHR